MGLLTLEKSLSLPVQQSNRLYARHLNAGLVRNYRLLGTAGLDVESAVGMEILLADGRRILDFSSSIGVLALGHNHPRILAAEQRCHDLKLLDAIKIAPHRLQAALAHNLAALLPDPLQVAFLTVSGAEAVEAGLKICEKAQGPRRTKFVTMDRAYHGKTHGALALTRSGGFQRGFLMGIPPENVIEVEYGSIQALGDVLTKHGHEIIATIIEPIQGEGLRTPPDGFLTTAVRLCRDQGVLTIFDEVKSGMGRTGTFCAFQREDVVPDVVTLSKALGGGKRAVGAMVSSHRLFRRAYGRGRDCALHTSTFSGLGESCAVAIETLNIYQDDSLVQHAAETGAYLRDQLETLRQRYPRAITELRGRGLMQGIRFRYDSGKLPGLFDAPRSGLVQTVESALTVSLMRGLLEKYDLLTHFAPSDPSVLHIMPPVIVQREHIDRLTRALDEMLASGFVRVATDFVKANLRDRLPGFSTSPRQQVEEPAPV